MDAVYIDSNGNVGIGTTGPMVMLEVDGDFCFEGGDGDLNLNGNILKARYTET